MIFDDRRAAFLPPPGPCRIRLGSEVMVSGLGGAIIRRMVWVRWRRISMGGVRRMGDAAGGLGECTCWECNEIVGVVGTRWLG